MGSKETEVSGAVGASPGAGAGEGAGLEPGAAVPGAGHSGSAELSEGGAEGIPVCHHTHTHTTYTMTHAQSHTHTQDTVGEEGTEADVISPVL